MKNLILLIFSLIIILLPVIYACEQKLTLKERLIDKCKIENGICDDGETPINDKDCSFDINSLSCKENRCIYNEIWFAKLLIIIGTLMVLLYKQDYKPWIIIILLLLAFNFVNSPQIEMFKKSLNNIQPVIDNVKPTLTQENINSNYILRIGQLIYPPNPTIGLIILIVGLFIVIRLLFRGRRYKR